MEISAHDRGIEFASEKGKVYCVAFSTLSVYPFSFPFGRKGNLASALALYFKPLIGSNDNLIMIPQILEQTKNTTRGAAWFCSHSEAEMYESLLRGDKISVFPAPVIMSSEADGSGLIIWKDAAGTYAYWTENYEPKMYRCFSNMSVEDVVSWMRSYAESAGSVIDGDAIRIYEKEDVSQGELHAAAAKTFNASPSLARLDFSKANLSNARDLAARITLFLQKSLAAGACICALSAVLLFYSYIDSRNYSDAPSEIYRAALGESSNTPLASVTRRLRSLSDVSDKLTLDGTLAGISEAWSDVPDSYLDIMRYGREGTEIEGRAAKTEDIQTLRESLSKRFAVRMGDVQQIPGGGLRFNLRLAGKDNAD